MRILPFGDRALLAEVDSLDQAIALATALQGARIPGVRELVPAARTVLVRIEPHRLSLTAVEHWITHVEVPERPIASGRQVSIPVRYDGEDLEEAAALLGITAAELVSRHSTARW